MKGSLLQINYSCYTISKAKGKQAAAAVEEVPAEPTNGNGEFTLPDHSRYIGDWVETLGVKCWHGQRKFTNGADTYTGEWVSDAMCGAREFVFGSGSKYCMKAALYEGSFKNNQFEGEGIDSAVYNGSWQNNKMHGKGVYTDLQA